MISITEIYVSIVSFIIVIPNNKNQIKNGKDFLYETLASFDQ